jgi:hypothetical protein
VLSYLNKKSSQSTFGLFYSQYLYCGTLNNYYNLNKILNHIEKTIRGQSKRERKWQNLLRIARMNVKAFSLLETTYLNIYFDSHPV